jgi:hypothetical protein
MGLSWQVGGAQVSQSWRPLTRSVHSLPDLFDFCTSSSSFRACHCLLVWELVALDFDEIVNSMTLCDR